MLLQLEVRLDQRLPVLVVQDGRHLRRLVRCRLLDHLGPVLRSRQYLRGKSAAVNLLQLGKLLNSLQNRSEARSSWRWKHSMGAGSRF